MISVIIFRHRNDACVENLTTISDFTILLNYFPKRYVNEAEILDLLQKWWIS
jgi:hypothetical protein